MPGVYAHIAGEQSRASWHAPWVPLARCGLLTRCFFEVQLDMARAKTKRGRMVVPPDAIHATALIAETIPTISIQAGDQFCDSWIPAMECPSIPIHVGPTESPADDTPATSARIMEMLS
jgi:hypothetical protein